MLSLQIQIVTNLDEKNKILIWKSNILTWKPKIVTNIDLKTKMLS